MAVVGAAAAADDVQVAQLRAQLAVAGRELVRIALVQLLRLVELGVALRGRVRPQPVDAVEPRLAAASAGATCVGCAQLTMKYAAAPSVSASTCSIASPSACPLGRRPSVSTVNEITTGRPTLPAARTIPIASSAYVSVSAPIRSTVVSANVSTCVEW